MKYTCPKCGGMIQVNKECQYDIDPETGRPDYNDSHIFINCSECEWDEDDENTKETEGMIQEIRDTVATLPG